MAILLLVGAVVGSRYFRSFAAVAVPANTPRVTSLFLPPPGPLCSLSIFVAVACQSILPQLGRPRSEEECHGERSGAVLGEPHPAASARFCVVSGSPAGIREGEGG